MSKSTRQDGGPVSACFAVPTSPRGKISMPWHISSAPTDCVDLPCGTLVLESDFHCFVAAAALAQHSVGRLNDVA